MLAVALAAPPAAAQQEFTRQLILVNTFEGPDARLGRSVAAALRGRVARGYNRRAVGMLGSSDVGTLLDGSGIDHNRPLIGGSLSAVARALRADEIVSGAAEQTGGVVRISARLILVRDQRLVEPLGPVTAPTLDSAVSLIADAIVHARRQLVPHRRCENAAREGAFQVAIDHAREVIAQAPPATLARTCLVTAMMQIGAPSSEVLREAQAILAVMPHSYWGLDAAARAYDALDDKPNAATTWMAVAATDSTNLDLQRRVLALLLQGGNAATAGPLVDRLLADQPEDLPLLRLKWQITFTLRQWKEASATGEKLLAADAQSREDSTFVLRLATALKSADQQVRAVALAADAVTRFPGDARLYVLYTQLVQAEAPVAVARGVERFPEAADLQLLHSVELRRSGRREDAATSLRKALALDPTLGQGYLQLAQTQSDLGQPDSALVSAHQALAAGEDSSTVAQFALARGNALYRAANATKQRADFHLAMRYLAFSDSVRATAQSRFLLGASALAVSQSAATDAPREQECELSRLAEALLPLAREKLTSGAEVAPDAARQYLEYLDQLEPVVSRQLETLCTSGGA